VLPALVEPSTLGCSAVPGKAGKAAEHARLYDSVRAARAQRAKRLGTEAAA
jgi:hypothetical protein